MRKRVSQLGAEEIYEQVAQNAARVAAQGDWPDYIPPESLLERLPAAGELSSGFDAGVACALDLIPRERQQLASRLHAAYAPDALEQVRTEAEEMQPDSEACWWLAACSVCDEDRVDQPRLLAQLEEFERLAVDPVARRAAARGCLREMLSTFTLCDGIPYGVEDGCMQGAYLAGHPLATMKAEIPGEEPLYYLGTYLETLGLEEFPWSDALDNQGRNRSGPVHGSRQYCKASDEGELLRAVAVARAQLGV